MIKNLLFIGGGGFIGSNLIRGLFVKTNKYVVHIIEPAFSNISKLDGADVTIHRCELSDFDKIESIILINKIDVVIHLASTLIPGSSYDDYVNEFKNIIFPSIQLMHLCAEKEIKFIYFSSGGTIYGNSSTMQPFAENDSLAPISYYGWSKQMMENSILFKNRTAGLNYLILRPSNPYGHGQNFYGKQGLIAVALGKILSDQPVTVWGDGSAVRDYIYIDDLAIIFYELLEKNVNNATLNIGSGRGYSVNDVLAFLNIITKQNIAIVYENARQEDVSNMVLDISELSQYVDIKFTPMLEGMSTFYNESKFK